MQKCYVVQTIRLQRRAAAFDSREVLLHAERRGFTERRRAAFLLRRRHDLEGPSDSPAPHPCQPCSRRLRRTLSMPCPRADHPGGRRQQG